MSAQQTLSCEAAAEAKMSVNHRGIESTQL